MELVIAVQSLGKTWDLPTEVPGGTELTAKACLLRPSAFNLVHCGLMSPGAGHLRGGRKRMNGWLRLRCWVATEQWLEQPPCHCWEDFVVRSLLPLLGC